MLTKFLKLLSNAVKNFAVYIWGGQGQLVRGLTKEKIYEMELSPEHADRVIKHIEMKNKYGFINKKTRAYDCSGLICYCLVKCGREEKGFDTNADGLFKRYPRQKEIAIGCLVHRPRHIGAYIGYGYLIESKGREYGVVISPFKKEEWDAEYANPWVNPEV